MNGSVLGIVAFLGVFLPLFFVIFLGLFTHSVLKALGRVEERIGQLETSVRLLGESSRRPT